MQSSAVNRPHTFGQDCRSFFPARPKMREKGTGNVVDCRRQRVIE